MIHMIHMIAIMADATVDKPMMRESVEEHRRWYLTPPPSLHEAYNGHQAMLPRLPIPPLRLTLRRYLDAALPFLGVAERDATVAAAAAFETSDGPRLRAELVALDALLPPSSSYIQESWCRVAYLQPREPSVVHSNPAALFAPPSWLSSLVASSHDTQLWRAATLLAGTARWTAALRGGTLPPPLGPGGVPLDMSQLPSLLGHARLPRKGCDVATSSFGRGAEHIVLGMAGRWYRVPIFTAAADSHQLRPLSDARGAAGRPDSAAAAARAGGGLAHRAAAGRVGSSARAAVRVARVPRLVGCNG